MNVRIKAPAKINLTLDITRKRTDGYHELRSIMQCVSLFDELAIKTTGTGQIEIKTNRPYLKNSPKNTAYIAADLFFRTYEIKNPGIQINIKKNIPVAAGLAGGSADAAAVLKLLPRMFRLKVPQKELMALGKQIGADVPFCLFQKTALCEGIGEIVTPLTPWQAQHILLATPPLIVSTASIFQKVSLDNIERHPDTERAIRALKEGESGFIHQELYNVLEEITGSEFPEIKAFEAVMYECGAIHTMMSGSGPTVFGIFPEKENAEKAAAKLRQQRGRVFLTQTI